MSLRRRFAGINVLRAISLISILGASLQADDKACSVSSLRGTYGYTITGTRPVPSGPSAGQTEQAIGVGVRRYDGYGGFTQVDTTKGAIAGAAVDIPTSGTYVVNSDCSGTAFLIIPGRPTPIEVRFVVVNDGKEIRWIVLNPLATMVTGVAVRL